MAGLSGLTMRPIAQNISLYTHVRGLARAPGFYSHWSIGGGGGGGAGYGNMNTPTWGYGQGGRRGTSDATNKRYIRSGVTTGNYGQTGQYEGGVYGTGTGGYAAQGKPVGGIGGSSGKDGWHDPSIRNPRGSMPTDYRFGGNRNAEVISGGTSIYYGEAGMGGIPPSNSAAAVNGGHGAPGYSSVIKRVLYG